MKITKQNIAVLEGDDYISRWVEQSGRLDHDTNMLPLLYRYIPIGGTVIDAGAYIADHTIFYSKRVGPKGHVLAFEPNKKAYECLEYNTEGIDNISIFNMGLSDEDGKIKLTDIETNGGMTFAEKAKKGVKAVTIDSLNLERLDFIKIDCEGFEHKILKGAEETIKKFKPVMLIEINNFALLRNGTSNNDIYIYLMELGYDYKNIYPNKHLYEEQLDLLCIPKK